MEKQMRIENKKWAPVDKEDRKHQERQAQKKAKDAKKEAKRKEK